MTTFDFKLRQWQEPEIFLQKKKKNPIFYEYLKHQDKYMLKHSK